jgi:hypothetical protein
MPQVAPIAPPYLPRLWVSPSGGRSRAEASGNVLLKRDNVGNGDDDELDDAPAADALHGAADDEPGHVLRGAAERRADKEDDDDDIEDWFAACDVGELAIKRRKGGGGEEVGAGGGVIRPQSEVHKVLEN